MNRSIAKVQAVNQLGRYGTTNTNNTQQKKKTHHGTH